MELSSKNMLTEQGDLEKKIDKVIEERDRLREDFDIYKSERERKIDEMRR